MDNRITAFEWITVDSYEGTLTSGTALVKASPPRACNLREISNAPYEF